MAIPNRNDVLFGRGHVINAHPGNQCYRKIVELKSPQFIQAKKRKEKREIANSVVREVNSFQPAGRFLMEGSADCCVASAEEMASADVSQVNMALLNRVWVVVDADKVIGKVLHRLREKAPGGERSSQRESLTKKESSRQPSQQGADVPGKNEGNLAVETVEAMASQQSAKQGTLKKHLPDIENSGHDTIDSDSKLEMGETSLFAKQEQETLQTFSPDLAVSDTFSVGEKELQSQEVLKAYPPSVSTSGHSSGTDALDNNVGSDMYDHFSIKSDSLEEIHDIAPVGTSLVLGEAHSSHHNTAAPRQASGISPGHLDEELASFLHDFSSQHDDEDRQLQEITLWNWIENSKSIKFLNSEQVTSGSSSEEVYEYVKSTLPIALKLTEFLIEAEKDEKNGLVNPIPLASIASENVLIRAKILDLPKPEGFVDDFDNIPFPGSPHSGTFEKLGTKGKEQADVIIDYVLIMTCMGEDQDVGDTMSRLCALGVVLYQLLTGQKHQPEQDMPDEVDVPSTVLSVNSISLSNNGESSHRRPRKKSSRSHYAHSDCITRLENLNIPHSLCALVENLFECSQGDYRGDAAYPSLQELSSDLKLMSDDSSRFLKNIVINPMPQLSICDKLYGRDSEVMRLEEFHQQHLLGKCSGVMIKGRAGTGKSRIAMHVESRGKGYFLIAKFDQNKDIKPLATIGNMFNELCEMFVQDVASTELNLVADELVTALGTQAALLAGVLPSLTKLVGSCGKLSDNASICVDSSMSMRFLFSELLFVLSSHCRPISLFMDDLQWADSVSLQLIGSLVLAAESSCKPIFFTCCYRDDEVENNEPLNQLLASITMTSLQSIKIENMAAEGVNSLVSDALHLSPRITRSLSSVLHHKTRGNPLFVRQLLESLKEQKLIYFQINPPRWMWELDKIIDLKVSDDVVALLINEMQRLPPDLQLALKVASCMGSRVKCSILDILSKDMEINLQDLLQQASSRGFLDHINGSMFTFIHDKIQQAAYGLMTEKQRRQNHMRFGLAICAYTLNSSPGNDDFFFTAVNHMNHGGPNVVNDPNQREMIARLNLNAGRRAICLSDFNAAIKLFRQGIDFLESDHWISQYDISIELFDAAAEASCVTDNRDDVTFYTEKLTAHAKCHDDKLNCLYSSLKALRHAELIQESMECTFNILLQLGEELPCAMGDDQLTTDMQLMNEILQKTPDDMILNMEETNEKKIITLLKLYENLGHVLHFTNPSLIGAVSIRMIDLTMKNGLAPPSAIAFAYYGEILTSIGNLTEGCRLGRLSLKLLEKEVSSSYKSSIICMVYQTILWACTPLQSIADAHLLGEKAGKQAGDFLFATLNLQLALQTSFVAGQSLVTVRNNMKHFIWKMQSRNSLPFVGNSILLHLQTACLQDGMQVLDADLVDNISTQTNEKFKDKIFLLGKKIQQVLRLVFFRQFDEVSPNINVSDTILGQKHQLRPFLQMGIFFEGLLCFQYARHANGAERWIGKGETILSQVACWSEHFAWNWENKMLLLKAEKMYILRDFDQAESLYIRSIRSANEHKFVHEEAIASEMAGHFYHERGFNQMALKLLQNSQKCYDKWGAYAVATRVGKFSESNFGSDSMQLGSVEDVLRNFFASDEGSSNKRRVHETNSDCTLSFFRN